jgi:hypothetical protein
LAQIPPQHWLELLQGVSSGLQVQRLDFCPVTWRLQQRWQPPPFGPLRRPQRWPFGRQISDETLAAIEVCGWSRTINAPIAAPMPCRRVRS